MQRLFWLSNKGEVMGMTTAPSARALVPSVWVHISHKMELWLKENTLWWISETAGDDGHQILIA